LAQQQQRAKYAADRRLALAKERGRRDFIPRKRRKAKVAKYCERLQDAKDEPKAASDATMTKRRKRMKRRETTQRRGLTEKRQTEKEKRRRTMEEEEEGSSSSIVKGWRREEVPGKEEILALEILVPGKEEILVLEKIK
jgi:hypothetical protein